MIKKEEAQKKITQALANSDELKQQLTFIIASEGADILQRLNIGAGGLTKEQAESLRKQYGKNIVTHGKVTPVWKRIYEAFINPFTVILLVLAVVSLFTDVILVAPEEKNYATVIIITTMVMFSGILRFVQETKSGNAAAELQKMIHTTTCVERKETGKQEIPVEDVVRGDIVYLSAGDMIPADMRILEAKDLFVSQSALTGESEPVEKHGAPCDPEGSLTEMSNLAFMGSTVVVGSAKGVVFNVGNDTLLGSMAATLNEEPPATSFEKGVNAVSWVLIRFMLIMVPIVFVVNGITKGDWLKALLFAISVAVGLTPEMLPMIVTTTLAKGAIAMSKVKVIIKNLNSIQNLGSMDILCTDKTGTLTQDKVVLERYLDINGDDDLRILRHAYLNSYFQTGLKNLIDIAVIERQDEIGSEDIRNRYTKVDEVPFDFARRRLSVVVADKNGKTQMVTKGAVEEMLACCSYAEYKGEVRPLTQDVVDFILNKTDELNAQGMRVLVVAQKTDPRPVGQFGVEDEKDMVLIGFLALLDPPKPTTANALATLQEHGVAIKILTGDNDKVTQAIAAQVGLEVKEVLLGADLEKMSDEELKGHLDNATVLAKLSPLQKARVITLLKDMGHAVGYMGDGINDAAAMKAADVGISVDTAVDVAKECASVILLEKDLNVLGSGIVEGRKVYANMIKYIKMTASSNFGNMFSVMAASAFLPFLPMEALHLIFLNLINDLSCTTIPWDNVDEEFLLKPRNWDASSVSRFMLWIGPVSSIFDIATYLLMYFVICPQVCGMPYSQITDPATKALFIALFQAGWFVESMWSQALVIHMIRTPKIPFIQSRASKIVTFATFTAGIVVTIIPFTPLGTMLGFAPLPMNYFFWLGAIIVGYMALVTLVKGLYIRKYGELL